MPRAARLLMLVTLISAAGVAVGCGDNKADAVPNPELGPPPNVPPGRGGDKGLAPTDPKAAKPPKGK